MSRRAKATGSLKRLGCSTITISLAILFAILFASSTASTLVQARVGDFVSTDYHCYEAVDDSITVQFSTALPTMQNWVGIISSSSFHDNESRNATPPLLSQWACGSQDDECDPHPGASTTGSRRRTLHHHHHLSPQYQRVTFANLTAVPTGSYHIRLKSYGYHGRIQELHSLSFTILSGTNASCEDHENHNPQLHGDLQNSIQVLERMYTVSGSGRDATMVEVLFSRNEPRVEDAVGIYAAGIPWKDLGTTAPLLWQWTRCAGGSSSSSSSEEEDEEEEEGDCSSNKTVPHGSLRFRLSSSTLLTGHYQAVLGRATMATNSGKTDRFLMDPIATTSETPFFVVDTTIPTSTGSSIYMRDDQYQYHDPLPPCSAVANNGHDMEDTNVVVQMSDSCFVQGDDIPVNFLSSPSAFRSTRSSCRRDKDDPHVTRVTAQDMVAIYPVVADLGLYHGTSLLPPRPQLWLYTCESKDCPSQQPPAKQQFSNSRDEEEKENENDTSLDQDEDESEWPLSVGRYKTVLIRRLRRHSDSQSFHYLYSESDPFDIVATSCPGEPEEDRRVPRRNLRQSPQRSDPIAKTTVVFPGSH